MTITYAAADPECAPVHSVKRRSLLRAIAGASVVSVGSTVLASPARNALAASTLPLTGTSATTGTLAIGSRVSGESFDRWQVAADGALGWGPGTVAPDVGLGRAGTRALGLGAQDQGVSLRLFGRPAGQANPSSYQSEVLSISTQSSIQRGIFASHVVGNGESAATPQPWLFFTQYSATDPIPNESRALGITSSLVYGVNGSTPVAATGTASATTADIVVKNSGSQSNEYASHLSSLRFDMGTGYPTASSTPGRGWLFDMGIHGPIGLQAGLLTGHTVFINNYHSVQPLSAESGGLFVVTKPGAGTAVDPTHAAAQTYAVGVGLSVLGCSGLTGADLGFNVGIRVGGTGSGWDVTTSRVGTGVEIRDHRNIGLRLATRESGSSAAAIQVDADAGNVAIGGPAPQAKLHVMGVITDVQAGMIVNPVHRVSSAGRSLYIHGGAFQPTAAVSGTLFGDTVVTTILPDGGASSGISLLKGSYFRCDTATGYAATIGEVRTIEIASPTLSGSGPVGTLTSLFIADQVAAATTKYAIYVEEASSRDSEAASSSQTQRA